MENLLSLMKNNTVNTVEYYNSQSKKKKTFNEVYDDVVSVAEMLRAKASHKGGKIGIVCRNKYEFVVLDLACIAGGYHFISFHYEDCKNKVNTIPSEFDLDLLFVDDNLMETVQDKKNILSVQNITDALAQGAQDFKIEDHFQAEDIFTTIFTSGSTGVPKGIDVKYKTVKHFEETCVSKFGLKEDDKVILFLPLSQYSSRQYVYSSIIRGFNIAVTIPENIIQDLKYYKPTVLQAVPYFFEGIYDTFVSHINASVSTRLVFNLYLVLKKICPAKRFIKDIQGKMFKDIYNFWGGNVRYMVTGAAPIRKEVLQFYNDIGLGLYESFGLIETGVITLSWPGCQKIGSVGKILEGIQVTFDEEQQIIVESDNLWGSAYVNTSDAENKKLFIGKGKVATGDIGYVDKDNFLYLKGRLKDVIVLTNGTKVHPIILEKELNSTDVIKQSAVFGNNKPFLIAVIVKANAGITEQQIHEEIKRINSKANSNHQIRGVVFADEAFSTTNKLVSSSMKLNRKSIYDVYKGKIEALY